MRVSLKLKISLALAIILLLTVGVLSKFVLHGIERYQIQTVEKHLLQQSEMAQRYISQNYLTEDERIPPGNFMHQRGQRLAMYLSMLSGMEVVLYDSKGSLVGNSMPLSNEAKGVSDTLHYAIQGKIAYQTLGNSLTYFSPLQIENKMMCIIEFHYSLKNNHDFLNITKHLFLTVGIIVFIVGFVVGYIYFYKIALIISKLQIASNHIHSGHFLDKPPVVRRDELGELSQDIFNMSNSIKQNLNNMNLEKQKLELAVQKLQVLEQQQKQFIGNISHEFKTPLTSIKAYVDLLSMYPDDPMLIEDAVQNISKQTDRLYEMVEKVLRLSALEKYDFEQQSQPIEMKDILTDICNSMRGKAAKYNLKIHTKLVSAVIWADRENLIHIFVNLIDNAIKYNELNGTIWIDSFVDNDFLIIDVKNTGNMVSKDLQKKIFDPFFTVNMERSREFSGTGLGLTIVRKLTEKQNGTVILHRSDRQGTVFRLRFPIYHAL
ncbi:histidine kinase [Heyndrickxia shackletonii]|uniref:histidine kinase n=1 Tax=Heyndrickxia shackletonii TaxID=157838 RepID=A0A0Q3WYB9_9BACI|nr:HAMP domain-containing sensor histidine kinase [Heyndrickxia shackletonii]KQL54149.1 histidine kinase [Heyndrickxia shackletonii]NEY99293.1 HAMP domain-containing histidine kinase [Heyndrickxia shackletonii]